MQKSIQELALDLRETYDSAPHGLKMTWVKLWAIKNINTLDGVNPNHLCELADLRKIGATINMGIRIAPFVTINNPNWPN